jgi:hypothetical protein
MANVKQSTYTFVTALGITDAIVALVSGVNRLIAPRDLLNSLLQATSFLLTSNVGPVTATTNADVTGAVFAVLNGGVYDFEFIVPFQTAGTSTGIALGITVPAFTYMACSIEIPVAAAGAAGAFQGSIIASDGQVIATTVQALNTTYLATVRGLIKPSANGNVQLRYARGGTSTNVTVMAGCHGRLQTLA